MKGALIFWTCLVFCLGAEGASLQWEKVSPRPTAQNLKVMTTGAGLLVAAGTGEILYSRDAGLTWTLTLTPGSENVVFQGIRFGNGIFVAVGNGRSFASADGMNWRSQIVPLAFLTLAFGNGVFVAGSASGGLAVSTDGLNWNFLPALGAGIGYAEFGNGRFVLAELRRIDPNDNQPPLYFQSSTNGTNWTRYAAALPALNCQFPDQLVCNYFRSFTGMTFGNGVFTVHVLRSLKDGFLSSTDGVTWTVAGGEAPARTEWSWNDTPGGPSDLYFKNGEYIMLGGQFQNGTLYNSTNLLNWAAHLYPEAATVNASSAEHVGSNYVIIGKNGLVERGATLDALARVDSPEKIAQLVSVAANGGVIVAVANLMRQPSTAAAGKAIVVSTNGGAAFRRATLPIPVNNLASVRFANGKFVTVGSGGSIFTSTNGVDWISVSSGTTAILFDVAYGNGLWIAVGTGGTIVTSPDATAFSPRTSGTSLDLYGVATGGGEIVAVGFSGGILRSSNAQNWTLTGTDEGTTLWSVTYGGGQFVAVGDNGRVYIASGSTWTAKRIIGASSLSRVAYAHGLFATMDFGTAKTYVSTDALAWSEVPVQSNVTLLGIDASDGIFWTSGVYQGSLDDSDEPGAVILREAQLRLSFGLAAGAFSIGFDTVGPDAYQIHSSETLTEAPWANSVLLTNVSGRVTWTDTNTPAAARFYYLRSE